MLFRFRETHPFHQVFRQQLVFHRLPERQVQHIAQVRQRFGGKAALSLQVPLGPPLIEKVLQILASHSAQIAAADLGLDVTPDELFVAAIGGQLHRGLGVFLQPAVHPLPHRNRRGLLRPSGKRLLNADLSLAHSQCRHERFSIGLAAKAFRLSLAVHTVLKHPAFVLGLVVSAPVIK